jgi:hypothetical protein
MAEEGMVEEGMVEKGGDGRLLVGTVVFLDKLVDN